MPMKERGARKMTQERTLSVTNDRAYAQTLLLIQELRSLRVSLASHTTVSGTQRSSSELCLCFLTLIFLFVGFALRNAFYNRCPSACFRHSQCLQNTLVAPVK